MKVWGKGGDSSNFTLVASRMVYDGALQSMCVGEVVSTSLDFANRASTTLSPTPFKLAADINAVACYKPSGVDQEHHRRRNHLGMAVNSISWTDITSKIRVGRGGHPRREQANPDFVAGKR